MYRAMGDKISQIQAKLVTKNKICSKHSHILGEGTADHHCSSAVCGANLPMHHTSSPGQMMGWLNPLAKMASRSEMLPLIQIVLLVVLQIPLYKDGLYKISLSISPTHVICARLLESLSKMTKHFSKKLLHNFALDVNDRCTAVLQRTLKNYAL